MKNILKNTDITIKTNNFNAVKYKQEEELKFETPMKV